MLLRLKDRLRPADRDSILRLCKDLGLVARPVEGSEVVLLLEGRPDRTALARLGEHPAVREVLERGKGGMLVEADPDRPPRTVAVGDARFGAGQVSIIAGPCAVEDETVLMDIARGVREAGATLLRGGAFKPRTSPYAFQGLGQEGLDILGRVAAATGIGIVTEVLDTRDVEAVAEVADLMQVGARNMANYALLKELASLGKPVLLKRGFGATVEEFLGAAEYLLAGGNADVVLCERGVRGFDRVTRNMLDVGAIAHLKGATHLPVVCDPSHAAGRADLVPALGRAGLAAGADGLMIEVHSAPESARSDAGQALPLERFASVVEQARALVALDGRQLVEPHWAGAAGRESA